MSEYKENAPQKIDLTSLILDIFKGIKKLWWLVICLALIFALKSYLTVSTSYTPQYIASATMAVRGMGSDMEYVNAETAEQMAEIFPYILNSGVLQKAIAEDMGVESMPGSVSMTAESGTNLFTISANANDPELSQQLLEATIRQYPEVAKFVIGQIEMEILDETGVPEDTGRERTIRGSFIQGGMKGATLGLVIMFFYIITRRTVKTRKELRSIVNLKDFGSIPHIAVKKRKKMKNKEVNLVDSRVPQIYLESMRKLRVKVLKEMEQHGYHSLMITSSIPGEGKTTISTNLAITLARQGKRVVLVDCDLRNPSVAENMGEENEHLGIGAVLRKEVSGLDVLQEIDVNGGKMFVLYGGEADAQTVKMLGTDLMGEVIEELEKHADIVVLDAAPSGLLADAAILARHVDAALYVVKADYVKKRHIRNGIQSLSVSGVNILGYVFNGDRASGGSSYGYGYGYKNYRSYYGYGHYGNHKKDDLSGRVIKD